VSRYKAYPEYKESGIPWLGQVPSHWLVSKVKHVAAFQVGWTPPTKNDENFVGDNLWANISDIKGREISETSKRVSDSAVKAASMQITPKGSLLYSFKLSVGAVSFAGQDMYTNEAIASFLKESDLPLEYLYYVLPKYLIENASTNIYGARILNQELICNANLIVPTFDEATNIAYFLDHETAKIDALIEKQQRLIELLKEKRQAVISHAVTKGLNPNAPMKDSGVEWLGEVPGHWVISNLRWFIQIASGDGLSNTVIESEQDQENQYKVIGGNGVMGYSKYLNTVDEAFAIGRVGALCGNVHFINYPCWVTDNALKLTNWRNFYPHYLNFLLLAARLNEYANRSAQPLITGEQVKALIVTIPPYEEQLAIANHISKELDSFSTLIERCQSAIQIMQERGTSLISAAVTGKIDVRDWQAAA
jgi:type I restriction enzyme S subunit